MKDVETGHACHYIFHFGALRNNHQQTMVKKRLGTHAASNGCKYSLTENVDENLLARIKMAAITRPIAICKPLPPLVFLLAIMAPIIVSRNTEKGVALRRYLSPFKLLRPSVPRSSSMWMILTN